MRTSGKVIKEFESFRKALFEEEISHFAFMRDGKCEILYTQKYVDKLENEIDKLKKENAVLKTQVLNKDKYSYGIRVGSDKE